MADFIKDKAICKKCRSWYSNQDMFEYYSPDQNPGFKKMMLNLDDQKYQLAVRICPKCRSGVEFCDGNHHNGKPCLHCIFYAFGTFDHVGGNPRWSRNNLCLNCDAYCHST